MQRGVAQLERPFVCAVEFGYDGAVFRLCIVGVEPAKRRQLQPAIAFDLRHHGAQRVQMRFEQNAVIDVYKRQSLYKLRWLPEDVSAAL